MKFLLLFKKKIQKYQEFKESYRKSKEEMIEKQ